ncbi:hypothetical protein C8J56DRAFT_1067313 [Mycena floridula]|nr:hypothetical protein C8J56DRAFT_1067313 [Mycena floridula]
MPSQSIRLWHLAGDERFDGEGWIEFQSIIQAEAQGRGLWSYLDGTVIDPNIAHNAAVATAAAASTTTAAQPNWTWNSLVAIYQPQTDLAKVTASRVLCETRLMDNGDFPEHVKDLGQKWAIANGTGCAIDDSEFRMILLVSLGRAWDTIVGTLESAATATAAITRLSQHWEALLADPQLVCSNCKHRGHVASESYWKGGGKEGQFPKWWKRKSNSSETHANTATTTAPKPEPQAKSAVISLADTYVIGNEVPGASLCGDHNSTAAITANSGT